MKLNVQSKEYFMAQDLKKVPLFADFTDEEIKAIQAIATKSTVAQGEYIFRENTPGDSLIILDMGTLRLTKKTESGGEQEIVQLGSGEYVGEMALFEPGLRSTSGQAMERCQLTIIPFSSLRPLLEGNHSLAAKFYRSLAMGITRRLRYMNEDFAALKNFLRRRD